MPILNYTGNTYRHETLGYVKALAEPDLTDELPVTSDAGGYHHIVDKNDLTLVDITPDTPTPTEWDNTTHIHLTDGTTLTIHNLTRDGFTDDNTILLAAGATPDGQEIGYTIPIHSINHTTYIQHNA